MYNYIIQLEGDRLRPDRLVLHQIGSYFLIGHTLPKYIRFQTQIRLSFEWTPSFGRRISYLSRNLIDLISDGNICRSTQDRPSFKASNGLRGQKWDKALTYLIQPALIFAILETPMAIVSN